MLQVVRDNIDADQLSEDLQYRTCTFSRKDFSLQCIRYRPISTVLRLEKRKWCSQGYLEETYQSTYGRVGAKVEPDLVPGAI